MRRRRRTSYSAGHLLVTTVISVYPSKILTASTNHWLTQTTSKECPPKLDRGAFFFRPVTAGSVFTLDPSIHTYIVLSGSKACGLALGHISFFLPSLSFSILA